MYALVIMGYFPNTREVKCFTGHCGCRKRGPVAHTPEAEGGFNSFPLWSTKDMTLETRDDLRVHDLQGRVNLLDGFWDPLNFEGNMKGLG